MDTLSLPTIIPEPGLCADNATTPAPIINPSTCSKATTPVVNYVPHHESVWETGGTDPLPIRFTLLSFKGDAELPRRHFGDYGGDIIV
jgi:hypothetical protein